MILNDIYFLRTVISETEVSHNVYVKPNMVTNIFGGPIFFPSAGRRLLPTPDPNERRNVGLIVSRLDQTSLIITSPVRNERDRNGLRSEGAHDD